MKTTGVDVRALIGLEAYPDMQEQHVQVEPYGRATQPCLRGDFQATAAPSKFNGIYAESNGEYFWLWPVFADLLPSPSDTAFDPVSSEGSLPLYL